MPAGTSMRNFDHYGQMLASKKFELYDFGKERNQ